MVFSSLFFLFVFLPLVLASYYIVDLTCFKKKSIGIKIKNTILLIYSVIFYAFGGIKYLLLIFMVLVINFLGACLVRSDLFDKKQRKRNLIIVICLNLGLLFFFKYFNMFLAVIENTILKHDNHPVSESIKNLFSAKRTYAIGIKDVVLPIGISFYIFQALSYVVDVYKRTAPIQLHFRNFALYISFFPQLIAGPIVQYSDVARQIKRRKTTAQQFVDGIGRFCYGLGKKVLIANTMAELADEIWSYDISKIGAGAAWVGIIAYTMQIYYDFSGYSDMAIGLGKMFGFNFKENFNYPYMSLSIQEFWRRWHISLSSWFREYIYIPLGGSRCSNRKLYRNIFVVFLLTGVWHGANWTFWVWGLMFALLLIIERAFLGDLLKKNPIKIINWIYTMSCVMLSWIFFRSESIFQAAEYIKQLFSKSSEEYTVVSFLSMKVIIVFVLSVFIAGPLKKIFGIIYEAKRDTMIVSTVETVIQFIILILCIMTLMNGTYNPFIYFQF